MQLKSGRCCNAQHLGGSMKVSVPAERPLAEALPRSSKLLDKGGQAVQSALSGMHAWKS